MPGPGETKRLERDRDRRLILVAITESASMIASKRASVVIHWAIAAGLLTPLCGLWFSCGCQWPWRGLFLACDAILKTTPPPHCPWCVHPLTAAIGVVVSLAAGTLAIRRLPALSSNVWAEMLYRTATSAGVFIAVLFLSGWLSALVTGHPSFLGIGLHA